MKRIAELLFEAGMLRSLPRSGYQFLGSGRESVAEHSFMVTFIAYVMGRLEPAADPLKLITMCLLHDVPEARTGDLNYVQKRYVKADEERAVGDLTEDLPFGGEMAGSFREFKEGEGLEARLARDADQLAFLVDLKALQDQGYKGPAGWIEAVTGRLCTGTGKNS